MNKIIYNGIKEDNLPFRIVNKALLNMELSSLPKGRYRLIIEKTRKNKSNPQLGYLFACIYPLFMQHLQDAGWEITSLEEVDMFCKKLFANQTIINRNTGEAVDIPALKRDMNTTDMMTYVEAIRQYDAEYLGGIIPEPETNFVIDYK